MSSVKLTQAVHPVILEAKFILALLRNIYYCLWLYEMSIFSYPFEIIQSNESIPFFVLGRLSPYRLHLGYDPPSLSFPRKYINIYSIKLSQMLNRIFLLLKRNLTMTKH